jgi:hypothetical protein
MGKSLERLRALADPLYRNDMSVRVGGSGATGQKNSDAVYDLAHTATSSGKLAYENKIEGVRNMGVEMVEKVEMVDGKVTVKVTPAFDAVGTLKDKPVIINPLIPGGN